jgi:thiol-disulfide isomerase/thioredoxin
VLTRRSAPLVLSLLLLSGACAQTDSRPTQASSPASSEAFTVQLYENPEPVEAFTVTTLDGRTLTSADLKGKVVLMNFWATWCAPCRAEIPALVKLQERYRDHLVIIGISEDEGPTDAVTAFAAEHHVNYPIAMTSSELQRVFPGVTALPTTFVLDRELRVAQRHVGMLDATRTERETLALAGLAVNARVEYIQPEKPVGLENLAQAKEIPGIDLSKMTPEKRVATLQRLNEEPCDCGCGLTVARCRIEDPSCGVSLPVARRIAAEVAGGAQ